MKRNLVIIFLCLVVGFSAFAKTNDVNTAKALTQRIIPQVSEKFVFKKISSPVDRFVLEDTKEGKIQISGNNANSMAMGLNYYLRYFCMTTVSWYNDIAVELPATLPIVKDQITIDAKVAKRFFLNYCTYGYTMPFWQWNEWERMIDWMALNGINMPLAITGQEAVWYKVWRKLGMTDTEIRSYFTGPTYLPWHRMANIDGWNGALPMEWLDNQVELQKKILTREREFNMTPVLPAFAGHVPAKLTELYPDANIKYLGKWAGFADEYRCHFLNPEEKLFAQIQKLYITEQTKLFGTDHIYGVDPFNEVDPPSWEPEYLKKVSSNMFRTLTAADDKAQWMQMTWMFYHDRKDWTSPRIKALLTGVPQNKMILLDYHCEKTELWKKTNKFHNQPYIWCYLGNFGGNTTITGNVKESMSRLDTALIEGGKNFEGIGSTLEGLDVAQFPYEVTFEKAWNINIPEDKMVEALANRHVGKVSKEAQEAWKILYNDIYVQVPRTLGILPNLRPVMKNNQDKRTGNEYDNKLLYGVWKKLTAVNDCSRDAMKLDLIIVGRQVLGNHFLQVKTQFDSAYSAHDVYALKARGAMMLEILNDLDSLNTYHSRTSLDTWIAEARNMGSNDEIKDYYEKNARNLITTWGGRLNDYASRTWAGLVKNYYAERWSKYIDAVTSATVAKKKFNQKKFDETMTQFENSWVNAKTKDNIETTPHSVSLQDYSEYLVTKYADKIK
ncbi:MAG: alpha-N-acetylglucosaminidase [Muribaculaceae bacterium]|nr:alpha-N-acetylglucosaminidase [Muribaculaceae bacterium]